MQRQVDNLVIHKSALSRFGVSGIFDVALFWDIVFKDYPTMGTLKVLEGGESQ